ncbi:MAG TPA: DUF3089 domain-containing protein [Acidimicrobiales bacterium]|nr:DUF3089 domain-containing protein [Acidimicrobiales bacterium]
MRKKGFISFFIFFCLVFSSCSKNSDTAVVSTTTSLPTITTNTPTTTTNAPTSIPPTTTVIPYDGYVSDLYSDQEVWLCWPGKPEDVCARDQTATAIYADGTLEVIPFEKALNPEVDCFYIYPTTSGDMTPNSDLIPDETQEIHTVWAQASRYSEVCDIYAPIYRQNTIPSLLRVIEVPDGVNTYEIAYADVVDAFKHYITMVNNGRGFILIGHSQGTSMLRRLLVEEIDQNPALRERLISAHLLGGSIAAEGKDFETIPACKEKTEIGCVLAYVTFDENKPPPNDSYFGRSQEDGTPALCTNPASFNEEGKAMLNPYFPSEGQKRLSPESTTEVTTPWITYPDFIFGECIDNGTFSYFSVEFLFDNADPRTDNVGGELTPQWGLHILDMSIALGNLVDTAHTQSQVYLEAN